MFYRRRAVRPIGGKSREKAEQASRAVSPEPPSSSSSSSHSPVQNRLVLRGSNDEAESSPPTYSSLPSPPSDSSSELDADADGGVGRMGDQSDSEVEGPDLRSVGEGLGFGNTAWGSNNGFTRPVVPLESGEDETTTTNVESDSGNATSETEELADEGVDDQAEVTGP